MSRSLERRVVPESLNAFGVALTVPSDHKFEIVDVSWNRQTGPAKTCVAALYNTGLGAVFFHEAALSSTAYCVHESFQGIVLEAGDQLWYAQLGASAGFCPTVFSYIDVNYAP